MRLSGCFHARSLQFIVLLFSMSRASTLGAKYFKLRMHRLLQADMSQVLQTHFIVLGEQQFSKFCEAVPQGGHNKCLAGSSSIWRRALGSMRLKVLHIHPLRRKTHHREGISPEHETVLKPWKNAFDLAFGNIENDTLNLHNRGGTGPSPSKLQSSLIVTQFGTHVHFCLT